MKKLRKIISILLVFVMLFVTTGARTIDTTQLSDPRLEMFNKQFDEWGILENGNQVSTAYGIKDGIKLTFTWDKYSNEILQVVSVVDTSILNIPRGALGNDNIILQTTSNV